MSINRWKKGYLCVGECLNPKPYVRVGASKWCAYERACERACVRACMSVCLFACMHECVCERVHACVWQCGACVVCYACSRLCAYDYSTSDRSRSLARSRARALYLSLCVWVWVHVYVCVCVSVLYQGQAIRPLRRRKRRGNGSLLRKGSSSSCFSGLVLCLQISLQLSSLACARKSIKLILTETKNSQNGQKYMYGFDISALVL